MPLYYSQFLLLLLFLLLFLVLRLLLLLPFPVSFPFSSFSSFFFKWKVPRWAGKAFFISSSAVVLLAMSPSPPSHLLLLLILPKPFSFSFSSFSSFSSSSFSSFSFFKWKLPSQPPKQEPPNQPPKQEPPNQPPNWFRLGCSNGSEGSGIPDSECQKDRALETAELFPLWMQPPLTYGPRKAVAEVSNQNEPIGRKSGIQLARKPMDFKFSCFVLHWLTD